MRLASANATPRNTATHFQQHGDDVCNLRRGAAVEMKDCLYHLEEPQLREWGEVLRQNLIGLGNEVRTKHYSLPSPITADSEFDGGPKLLSCETRRPGKQRPTKFPSRAILVVEVA
jgi:hypothetical protein